MSRSKALLVITSLAFLSWSASSSATVIEATIRGSDAIWLAGRTDVAIPDASASWPGGLLRHGGPTPEEIKESTPPGFTVQGGDVIRVLDPASGGISFFNGYGGLIFGPEGNGVPGSSSIGSFGGISGYLGTQGALVGVFLDNNIPNGTAPVRLDFTLGGHGIDFPILAPALAQVFFIGNGVAAGGAFQQFIAPSGATRLFLGVPDAFGFNGAPGAYDDNDGSYLIRLGINEDPRNPVTPVPEPSSLLLTLAGLATLAYVSRRRLSQLDDNVAQNAKVGSV